MVRTLKMEWPIQTNEFVNLNSLLPQNINEKEKKSLKVLIDVENSSLSHDDENDNTPRDFKYKVNHGSSRGFYTDLPVFSSSHGRLNHQISAIHLQPSL